MVISCPLSLISVCFQVILTGDRSEVGGARVFRSRDYGLSFTASDLPFLPLIQMLYNPADCNILLTLSMTVCHCVILFCVFGVRTMFWQEFFNQK